MKKITLAMSALLTAGAWCGLAYADDATVTTPEEPQTVTMNFQETQYGAPVESGSSQNFLPDGFTITDGNVLVSFGKNYTGNTGNPGNGSRFWLAGSATQLRVYTRSNVTFTVPGGKISSVEVNGTSIGNLYVVTPSGDVFKKETNTKNTQATFSSTAGSESLEIRSSGTTNINNIKITYVGGEITTKSADIKFASDNVEIPVGETYTIDMTKATTAEVSYVSGNDKVATVNESGVITAVGVGTTNILATAPANDEFSYGYASIAVTVLPEGTISYSALGEEYTFENPEEIAVWEHSTAYGLKATAYNGSANAAEAMAISEPISMPAHRDITLTFQQATNSVNGVTTETFGNYFKMFVREVADEEGGDGGFGGFDDGGIALLDDQTPVEGEGGEETEESAWVEVPGATVPSTVNSDWTFRAKSVNMTEFAGKKIQIAFKYISTAEVCPTWEIKEITFVAVDPLAAEKKAAIAEITTYMNQLSGDQSWNLENRISQVEDCYTTEDIDRVVAQTKEWIIDNAVYSMASTYFVWNVGDKVAGYAVPFEGVSPWIVGDFTLNSLWIAEMIAEDGGQGGIAPAADEAETEPETPAIEPSEYAFRIKNVKSGLYVAAPGEAGTIIGSTDKAEEAGVYVIACIEGKVALVADANNAVTVNWDAEKGMVSGTTYETMAYDEAEMWDDQEEPVQAAITGATSESEWAPNYATEISEFTVSVPSEAKLSGFGEISFYTEEYDPITYTQNRTVIATWSAEAVAAMTPVVEEVTLKVWKDVDGEFKQVEVKKNYIKYTFNLRNVQTMPGDYIAFASEFMWYIEKDGVYTFSNPGSQMATIQAASEGMALNVTPAEGTVTAIDKINITAADPEMLFNVYYSGAFDAKVTLTKGETEVKTWTKDEVAAAQLHADDWSLPVEYELAAGVTEAGTYTLTIPAEFFENDNMETNDEIVMVWTIEEGEDDAISEITLGGAAVKVYDLQGRQLAAPVKGAINIINGKKVLVK